MEKTVSAAQANRDFSRILRDTRDGASFVVTSHGQPIARITPFRADASARDTALQALLHRLETAPPIDIGIWSRDELYE